MKNVLIINGHLPYVFSQGKLTAKFIEQAELFFDKKGFNIQKSVPAETYNVDEEIEKLKWADFVFLQSPINWMGMPWTFKKYIDDVWSVGMMGSMSDGDGRSSQSPKKNYGLGGKLTGKYMLSLTANAPEEAFNDHDEKFFEGISIDDLMIPTHLNFKWIGFEQLPTFIAHDVLKNPQVESDLKRFETHLTETF